MIKLPTPHGDKLRALLQNSKLPNDDKPRTRKAVARYEEWVANLASIPEDLDNVVSSMVSLLNTYKRYIELDLIFDSKHDFLYRQKGQLKLDNTIIEEFLPILVTSALETEFRKKDLMFGPATCFSGVRFESSILDQGSGGGMTLRGKDHDFAISRRIHLRASYDSEFTDSITKSAQIAYVAAECKTNLDKTMFQEASATALDVKLAVPGAKYFLLAEWLDMTPISTAITAIDEVLILRRAKRLSSNIRREFNSFDGRQANRALFADHLQDNPFSVEIIDRLIEHIRQLVQDTDENDVLNRGYF